MKNPQIRDDQTERLIQLGWFPKQVLPVADDLCYLIPVHDHSTGETKQWKLHSQRLRAIQKLLAENEDYGINIEKEVDQESID